MHRRIAALTLVAVAILGLTACTGSADPGATPSNSAGGAGDAHEDAPGDEGQTTQDACSLLHQTIAEATEAYDATEDATPESVVEAMQSATETLSQVSPQITNDDVAALLPDLIDMFAQTAEVMGAIISGDTDALGQLSELGDEFTDTTSRYQELCLS